jgi:predicted FMN-binding regulatory protein PaiB
MYLPKQFQETRVEVLHELIDAHPLAALVTLTATAAIPQSRWLLWCVPEILSKLWLADFDRHALCVKI